MQVTGSEPILVATALSFMGIALLAIIGVGWSTRELVKDVHSTVNNKQSGIDAIWEAINGLRDDYNELVRERHESSPPKSHG